MKSCIWGHSVYVH